MKSYFVYVMTNTGRTVLYIGVTNSLVRRVSQHRKGEIEGFTEQYNVNRLMYFEELSDINAAIVREKQLKRWRRNKKETLVRKKNPAWADLAVSVLGLERLP